MQTLIARDIFLTLTLLLLDKRTMTVDGRVKRIDVVTFVAVPTAGRETEDAKSAIVSSGVAPLETAICDVNNLFPKVFNMTLTKLTKHVHCSQLVFDVAKTAAEYYYQHFNESDMIVFITPGCGEQNELNMLAAGLDVPLINTIGRITNDALRNGDLSPTYLSTGYLTKDDFARPIENLLDRFGWTSVFIVTGANAAFGESASAHYIAALIQSDHKRQVSYGFFDTSFTSTMDWTSVLTSFTKVSRVCLFIGADTLFRSFLAYVTYTFYSFNPGNAFRDDAEGGSEALKEAFRSVLVLMATQEGNGSSMHERTIEMAKRWITRAVNEFGINFGNSSASDMTPYLLSNYIAVSVLGTVLDQTLWQDPRFDLRQGNLFVDQFLNRTVWTKYWSVTFDTYGIRRTDIAVKHYDISTGILETVMVNEGATDTLYDIQPVAWRAGVDHFCAPKNEPDCGYMGDKAACQSRKTGTTVVATATVFVILFITAVTTGICKRARSRMFWDRDWWNLNKHWIRLESSVDCTASSKQDHLNKMPFW